MNKFGNGNAQFSVGMGVKKMVRSFKRSQEMRQSSDYSKNAFFQVCPDPFMGALSDPNMNR